MSCGPETANWKARFVNLYMFVPKFLFNWPTQIVESSRCHNKHQPESIVYILYETKRTHPPPPQKKRSYCYSMMQAFPKMNKGLIISDLTYIAFWIETKTLQVNRVLKKEIDRGQEWLSLLASAKNYSKAYLHPLGPAAWEILTAVLKLVLKIRNVLWFASVQSICFIFVNISCFEKQRKRPLIRGYSDQVNFEPVLTQSWGGLEFSKGGIGQTSAYIIQLLLLLNKSFFHKIKILAFASL